MTMPSFRTELRARRGGDAGQVLPITALVIVLLMVAVAFAVDLSSLTNEKQELHDSIDAAAQAGAYELPGNAAAAQAQALAFADANNDGSATPTIDFWCIVGSTGTAPNFVVNTTHIPATCNPGVAPYNATSYPGLRCNETICAIPCVPAQGDVCNTIRVADSKLVPYHFAPVIGDPDGDTGNLVSVACKGACGSLSPKPIDFAFVADRTGSMSDSDRNQVSAAIRSVLSDLDPALHRASLGVIGRRSSTAPASCRSQAASSNASSNPWMAVGLTSTLTSGELWNAVQTSCFLSSGTGTHLAAPYNAARNVLQSNGRADALKALVFMTDGEPNETDNATGAFTETIGNDWGRSACNNATVAANGNPTGGFKDLGTPSSFLSITIAFRLAGTRCSGSDTTSLTFALSGCTTSNSSAKTCTVTGQNGSGGYTWSGSVSGTANTRTFTAAKNGTYTIQVTSNGETVQRIVTCSSGTNWACSVGAVTFPNDSYVADVLAAMASDSPSGGASTAYDSGDAGDAPCSSAAEADVENSDGDFFFCTADANDLASIYETAVSSAGTGIRFIRLP